MCGLVGVAGNVDFKADKAIKTLLILDAIRGTDSTGAAFIHNHQAPSVVKQLGNPYELFESRGFLPNLNKRNRAIIGHNRFATQGEVNRKNAHPFEFDTLIGTHNGTLTTKYLLDDPHDFKVDSENLYHHIEKNGIRDAMKVCGGAWSLVWWDKLTENLCFLRNKERPMWVVRSEDQKTMFWASESWMLEIALQRADIKYGELHSTAVDFLYEIHIDSSGTLGKPVLTEMPSKYVAPIQHHKGQNWYGSVHTAPNNTSTNVVVTSAHTPAVVAPVKSVVSNIVDLTEKKSTASRKFYVSSKGVELELDSLAVDANGATYVHCFDPLEPHIQIRLYYKKNDPVVNRVGAIIIADIKDIKITPKEGTYYKVGRYEVKEEVATDLEEKPEGDDEIYMNHRGKYVSKGIFEQNYPCCACCDGYVNPQEVYKFTVGGDGVCHICVADNETTRFYSLV